MIEGLFGATGDDLHVNLRAAAERGPLITDPSTGATVVLRHRDVEMLARDHRVAGIGLTLFDLMGITDGPLREWYGGLMFTNEGEKHDRLRKLVARAFTPRSVEALREHASSLANAELDGVEAAGGGDLVPRFALLAMRVMCKLLGVPESDVGVFGAWTDALSPIFGIIDADQQRDATSAVVTLLGYVEELAAKRRSEPADDLISALIAAETEGDRLTHDESVAMVANLLVGGHDTTTSQIGCSLLTLLRYPDQAARVREDPSIVQSAVEETIRFEPSIPAVPRTVIAPLEVAGAELPPGTFMTLCTASANREPGVWDEPDRFDVTRFAARGGPGLLSFGAGTHFCLGAALARMTLQESASAVAQRMPRLRLDADAASLPWRVVLGRSPATLPVVAA